MKNEIFLICHSLLLSDLSLFSLTGTFLSVASMTSIEWECKASTLLVRTIQLGKVALLVILESKHSNAQTERLTIQFMLWMLNSTLSKSVQMALGCSCLKKIRNKISNPVPHLNAREEALKPSLLIYLLFCISLSWLVFHCCPVVHRELLWSFTEEKTSFPCGYTSCNGAF